MITNIPYVKQYDANGKCTNPIVGAYLHEFENRQARRAHMNQPNFRGNVKHVSLTVNGINKFKRFAQRISYSVATKIQHIQWKYKTVLHYLAN